MFIRSLGGRQIKVLIDTAGAPAIVDIKTSPDVDFVNNELEGESIRPITLSWAKIWTDKPRVAALRFDVPYIDGHNWRGRATWASYKQMIPDGTPGIYLIRWAGGAYIGNAKNIRERLDTHFQYFRRLKVDVLRGYPADTDYNIYWLPAPEKWIKPANVIEDMEALIRNVVARAGGYRGTISRSSSSNRDIINAFRSLGFSNRKELELTASVFLDGKDNTTAHPLQEEIRGPVHASITWTTSPLTLHQVIANVPRPGYRWKGGVYILLNQNGHILKAGQTHDFAKRANDYTKGRYQGTIPEKRPYSMYLGRVTVASGSVNPLAAYIAIERAIIRTLIRLTERGSLALAEPHTGRPLPLVRKTTDFRPNPVVNHIKIKHLLPARLAPAGPLDVRDAYNLGAAAASGVWSGTPAPSATARDLYLAQDHSPWEI